MNFIDAFMLLEEEAKDMATTFDVYKGGVSDATVRFNNKEMSLRQFVELAKKNNPEAVEILAKLKSHPKFKEAGNLYEFLTKYLKDNDGRLDLVLRKGLTQYDNDEISRNSKNPPIKQETQQKIQTRLRPDQIKYPKNNSFRRKSNFNTTTLRIGT